MEMKKEIDIIDKEDGDQSLPVYDTYIIDEEETPPSKSPAYKLGRAAGSAIAFAGFVNRVIQTFRSRRETGEPCPGDGTGKGRGKRYRRKRI